jgi:DNA-binding NarL/FixJ family response regulator
VRIALAEDSVLLREGLARLLVDAGHDVSAQAGDAEGLLAAVEADPPDVVVTDVRMPPSFTDEGTRAALAIRERWPDVGVLVLAQHVEARNAVRLLRDHPYGIGYLLKDRVSDVEGFLAAVRTVADGGQVVDPEVVSALLRRTPALSQRERDVLDLVAQGRSNKAIAALLFVTPRTVETHVASIFLKLGIDDSPDDNRRVLAVLEHLRSG